MCCRLSDSSDAALEELYRQVEGYQTGGGTDIYVAAAQALELAEGYDLSRYTPAVILMTDGQSEDHLNTFVSEYESLGLIFRYFPSLLEMRIPANFNSWAELTGGRVFDGTEDLTEAFRSVKGYN